MKAIILSLFSFFLAAIFTPQITHAQNKKVDQALNQLLDTKFMKKYIEMRNEAEKTVLDFKLVANQYDPADVKAVEQGYIATQREFDKVLIDLKADLTDPKKRKFVQKFPEMYGNGMESKLDDLGEVYAVNLVQPIRDATGNEIDGSPLLLLITELIGATSELVSKYINLKIQAKQFSDGYLQENLVEPYEFKDWDEIGSDTNNTGGYDDQYNQGTDYDQGTDYNNNNQGTDYNNGGTDTNNGGNSNDNSTNDDWDW